MVPPPALSVLPTRSVSLGAGPPCWPATLPSWPAPLPCTMPPLAHLFAPQPAVVFPHPCPMHQQPPVPLAPVLATSACHCGHYGFTTTVAAMDTRAVCLHVPQPLFFIFFKKICHLFVTKNSVTNTYHHYLPLFHRIKLDVKPFVI